MQEEDIAPSVNLLESMRSVGYSFEAALGDIIDNSITAGARVVNIDTDVVEGEYVAILDDGRGMSAEAAREALRFAGVSGDRDRADLGRFGLGLKTASLSQARWVTVATRADNTTTVLRWDVDHVLRTGRWSLLVLSDEESRLLPMWSEFDRQENGTLVVWQQLDLLLGEADKRGELLRDEVMKARTSLSLVFHRYLKAGLRGLTIKVNGANLKPIDPFLESNSRTQVSSLERVPINGEVIEVTAFTLPHTSGLSPTERKREDLSNGMRDSQGFYIYRNQRLISYGGWYGLAAKTELTKQTRIRVDIPNTLDHMWQLDIKKSRAEPPPLFKAHLRRIIDPILDRGRRVHTFRGRKDADTHITRVWDKIVGRDGKVAYVINRDHPLLSLLRSSLPSDSGTLLDSVIDLLASDFPASDLYAVMAANGVTIADSPEDEQILDRLRLLQSAGILDASSAEATTQLATIEPFNRVGNLHDLLKLVMEETTSGTDA